ncbi:vanadium-dependent haloperoxidase [Sinorhizobium medicae]|uniref:vanadium-dependent haloperoxidase n=1 Tax=Sinorhizobium medicae TaxID=110321 RepID=UPI000FDBB7D8|nr:vanadium-dependent haloperoxidase [Sinorhizobium medicae]RVJ71710.1 phosphatase PAP2 family protein [Sinorhizobium medicae]
MHIPNAILFWSDIASEAHRRDYTFDDALGDDELGTPMDRQNISPNVGGPTRVSRAFAIIHLAMYDALLMSNPSEFKGNLPGALQNKVQPYQTGLPTPTGPLSREAAVAGAAATTIQHIFGGNFVHDALNTFRVLLFRAGHSHDDIEAGLTYGSDIGRLLLDLRSNDASEHLDVTYREFPINGVFRRDPFDQRQGVLGPNWGQVTPFGGYAPSDVTFVGPLEALGGPCKPVKEERLGEYLGAPGWLDDLRLVREKGGAPNVAGMTRTPEETLIGIFWAYDGVRDIGVPPRLYNQCLAAIAEDSKVDLNVEECALLFGLAHLGMADAGIAAWHEKYTYQVARPVTGVREADIGFGPDAEHNAASPPTFAAAELTLPIGNATYANAAQWLQKQPSNPSVSESNSFWAPLGAPQTNTRTGNTDKGVFSRSPGFPAYPSGHATFGSACFTLASEVLRVLGKDPNTEFTFISDELDGTHRDPDGSIRIEHRRRMTIAQAIHENAWSRIYLGVHWRMDAVEGVRLGLELAEKIKLHGKGPASIFNAAPIA